MRLARPAAAPALTRTDRRGSRAFTLIELVVVVAVVAILASIAIASYSAYVVRSKRATAKTALLQDAQFMERNYTVAGCYTNTQAGCAGAALNSAALPVTVAPQEGTAVYNVTLVAAVGAGTFTLTATPIAGVFSDPDCGWLSLDNTGTKNQQFGTVAACWQR